MTKKLTIEDARALAKKQGLVFLDEWFHNSTTKHRWQCPCGGVWLLDYNHVKHNHISCCPKCSGKAKITIKDIRDLEKRRGISFVDEFIVNSKFKHRWKCPCGIIWSASYNNVNRKSVTCCPSCSGRKGERLTIEESASVLGVSLKKCKMFKDRYRCGLELDGYSVELKLAIERQGEQHYGPIRFGGASIDRAKERFQQQQHRDALKRQFCKQDGITLIEVPYWVKHEDLRQFIVDELLKSNRQDIVERIVPSVL